MATQATMSEDGGLVGRILVADDDPRGRELVGAILTAAGHRVLNAGDGQEALELLESTDVDLVLLDFLMPRLNGIETCARLRADPRHRTLPVVFITAQSDRASRIEGKRVGADDFLTKPFDGVELLVRVRNLLRVKAWYDLQARQREAAEEALERIRAQLLHAERLATLGTLAAGVGHELNNIAMVLQSASYFIRQQVETGEAPEAEDLEQLQRAVEHVALHGKQLLALGQPRAAGVTAFDVRQAVQGTLDLLRTAGRTRYVTVETDLPAEPVYVRMNRTHVEQVLINLVGNAADALDGARAARVSVALRPLGDGGRVECAVGDNGPGMTPEVRARAFEPYFTTKAEGRGTGLGLSVVRQIVESYGGTLRVESEPGAGTTMTFDLPAHVVSARVERPRA